MEFDTRAFVVSLMLFVGVAGTANAVPISFEIRATETNPSSGDTFVGSLFLDDSLLVPNTFIEAIDVISFEITIRSQAFVLADVLTPTDTGFGAFGFLVNSAGTGVVFATTTPGPIFNLQNSNNFGLGFYSDNGAYALWDLNLSPAVVVSSGFWVIPEPSTATLLALGLVGMAAGRRRTAARAH